MNRETLNGPSLLKIDASWGRRNEMKTLDVMFKKEKY